MDHAEEIKQLRAELATAQSQRADFRRQLTAEREGRLAAEKIVDEVRARNRELEAAPITDNDRRWRFLEHGCQWVSWVPINGAQVSFDPRTLTGFSGDLNDMRGQADIEIRRHLYILQEGAAALERKLKDG